MSSKAAEHRSGFVALVGRPNTGKSTLANAMVGGKVAITSSKPQTTRRTIRGIVRREGYQVVLVDTPGWHKPRNLLGERLNSLVNDTMGEVDCVVMCLPATDVLGPGDRFIMQHLPDGVARVAAVTKVDLVDAGTLAERLEAVAAADNWDDIVPVSGVTGFQVDVLTDLLGARMPEGPELYPDGEMSDMPLDLQVADLVREAALEDLHDEMPHSVAVSVDEITDRDDDRPGKVVRVSIYVERDSQKGIMIGKGGARLKEVGTRARREVEALLGERVYLDLHVKVAKDWQRDPKQLERLGF